MKSSLSSVWRYINTFNYISLQTIKHFVKGCWQNARYCFDPIFVHLISALICSLLWGQSLHLLTDETPATQSRETLLFNYTLTGERSDTNTVTAGSAEPISLIERLQVMTESDYEWFHSFSVSGKPQSKCRYNDLSHKQQTLNQSSSSFKAVLPRRIEFDLII